MTIGTGKNSIRANTTHQQALSATQEALANAAAGVSLRSVTKKYGPVTAVENITLDIPAGYYCCLLGPSGCGKTTLLRMIAGHEEITSGDILIGARRVNDIPAAKRNTSMMFQSYALFPHMSVWQNVEFGLEMQQVPTSDRRTRVGEMLEMVGLSHLADRKSSQLSGGQQQRIALARSLVTRPQVLMLDEPLSALDENLRVQMRTELRRIQKQFGMTFIQVTHHVEEAFSLSDMVVVMSHGHLDQVATPSEMFKTPASQFVAKFMGDNNIFQGKVRHYAPDSNKLDLIELEVEGIGSLYCRGQAAPIGSTAACCVRPDLMKMESYSPDPTIKPSHLANHISARIVSIEMTGYVTRVCLLEEKTGKELLYKVRTTDWEEDPYSEGQLVTLRWSEGNCVFLPH
ncbi:ABC transporter ATP-binding protein [Microcoleus sp. FACHB-SPT15]|uniref:ABC transporter ATP-binding protein n=1 Tax=Microcoleus sp. FACHB-SPT15 TaxID=2692830 RepID=UPI00178064E0|nr:ABC transporter ATP-binding protein [Microcoleus sp. FACHB-SPT15]MBD1809534.1 ABC transporter ATP-binding protein [Microcoleus sp. FACHB-SPT15]